MKYRKKPVVIEAFKYEGDFKNSPKWISQAFELGDILHYGYAPHTEADSNEEPNELFIETLEGTMKCSVGNYIIKGVSGELYSCDPIIFEKTYEKVSE